LKKRLIILGILVCIFLFSSIIALSNDVKYDFRKTNWGMSKEQVKTTEKNEIAFEDEEEICYKVKIGENNFLCGYIFLENKLYRSGYLFNETHTNENDYIDDYEKLKAILIDKYGKPKTDKIE